ncbi:fungal-specific transcription factor domain-containing protein [Cerioporus squamosus]|nr:fungal-specific transcription factor domain-containing protein [Cerioporus squamosus]
MSGEDEDSIPRRRMKHSRACDLCRRRKVCCDASVAPGNRCSRCTAAGIECQYNPVVKTSGRPTKRYVEALEDRLKRMEGLVKKLYSNAQTTEHPESDSSDGDPRPASGDVPVGAMAVFSLPSPSGPAAIPLYPPSLHKLTDHDSDELESSEDEAEISLGNAMGYHGKSSNKDLILTLLDFKKGDTAGKRGFPPKYQKRPCMVPKPFELPIIIDGLDTVPHKDFPEPDLMVRLIDAYFEHLNIYLPLLHRPTFEHDLQRGLHFRDRSFGTIVLVVCAIGCIWTEDPRIRTPEVGSSAGWEWFDLVGHEQWSLLTRPKLHDLQACALMAAYMTSTHTPQSNWMMLTLGIRMAVDAGAHRKKTYSTIPMVEQEQWKRAFWVLVTMDRMASFALGRPCAIHDEDFDLDPMTECDDEYWFNPDPALSFKQPAGKPSKIAFANSFIRLLMILAFASRTIYTINKSKLLLGFVGAEWKQNIVAEIDSALNKWRGSVPAHLRWNPPSEDPTFFKQSAFLYINFYQIQIYIHRQFIPSPRRTAPTHQLPSLTICVSAARACMEVIEVQWKRTGISHCALAPLHIVLFTTAVVLLMNLWGGKPSAREAEALVADVRKCVNVMKELEVT